jgi:hypothetical protein
MYALLPGRARVSNYCGDLAGDDAHSQAGGFLIIATHHSSSLFSSWTVARTGLLWQRRTCGYVGISNGAT